MFFSAHSLDKIKITMIMMMMMMIIIIIIIIIIKLKRDTSLFWLPLNSR